MEVFHGTSASFGIADGTIFTIPKNMRHHVEKKSITQSEHEAGWERFRFACKQTIDYFQSFLDTAQADEVAIFQTYILMLQDESFMRQVNDEYKKHLVNIEYIVEQQTNEAAKILSSSNDPYLMERAQDITDVFGKVIDRLTGSESFSFSSIPQNSIVVAYSINPTDALFLSKYAIAGLILEEGGQNSHLSILARSYSIPLVFGIKDIYHKFKAKDFVILDAINGKIIFEPSNAIQEYYAMQKLAFLEHQKRLDSFKNKAACTQDGVSVQLYANIGSYEEAKIAQKEGADGIGLFRTEFLFMSYHDKELLKPEVTISEDEQYEVYKNVLLVMQDKPVTMRTLDIGGDKILKIPELSCPEESNPLLGWRAIRISLDKRDFFKVQLRALLRAGVHGNLSVMVPMITSLDEFLLVKEMVSEVEDELSRNSIPFKKDIPLGVMIETPAAALISQELAKHAAFFSIGSNDLTQYTLCVDRENHVVSHLYNETHPAVLALIKQTIKAAKSARIPLSVCGEMAGKEETIQQLVTMGVTRFSMQPKNISVIKEALSRFSVNSYLLYP